MMVDYSFFLSIPFLAVYLIHARPEKACFSLLFIYGWEIFSENELSKLLDGGASEDPNMGLMLWRVSSPVKLFNKQQSIMHQFQLASPLHFLLHSYGLFF